MGSISEPSIESSISRGQEINLPFNSDIVNFLLKTDGEVLESLMLLFFWFRVL